MKTPETYEPPAAKPRLTVIVLPHIPREQKWRYLKAAKGKKLEDWVFEACDSYCAAAERCPTCGGELSQCGQRGEDGLPKLSCHCCKLLDVISDLEDQLEKKAEERLAAAVAAIEQASKT